MQDEQLVFQKRLQCSWSSRVLKAMEDSRDATLLTRFAGGSIMMCPPFQLFQHLPWKNLKKT